MDSTDPQQWATELDNAITNRSTPILYAVTTNWWNDFRTWLMLLKEGFQLEFNQGEGFMGSSNKLDNSSLIKEGDYNERTMLHLQMKDLQKDSIKIIQDYFMIDPQRFHINQDYSLISSEAYHMIIKLSGGGPHIRFFLQDSQDDLTQTDNLSIITSDMEGRECIGQGKIAYLNVLQLGVILNHNENSTLEVGYYPFSLTLQELVNSFPINSILYSAITVDLSHCQYNQDPTNNHNTSSTPEHHNNSDLLLRKTIAELGIAHGSIVVFTLHSLSNEDEHSMEQEHMSFHNESTGEKSQKKYRKRDQFSEEPNNQRGNKFLHLQPTTDKEHQEELYQNAQVQQASSSTNLDYIDYNDQYEFNKDPMRSLKFEGVRFELKQSFHSDVASHDKLSKNNSFNNENQGFYYDEEFRTNSVYPNQHHGEDIFKENNNHNADNFTSQQEPLLKGNRRGNVIFRKKPDNSNASTEENQKSIPDTEDLGSSRSQFSNHQLAGGQTIIGGLMGRITNEEIEEIRTHVEQCQPGQMQLEILPQKVVIENLEGMVEELGQKIHEMKQLKVKMEQSCSGNNNNNGKAKENNGKIVRGNNRGDEEEEEEEGQDRKEEDYSERTSSTSTQPDNGKCFKNKQARKNILGTNQTLQASNLLDQSNMTDVDEQQN